MFQIRFKIYHDGTVISVYKLIPHKFMWWTVYERMRLESYLVPDEYDYEKPKDFDNLDQVKDYLKKELNIATWS